MITLLWLKFLLFLVPLIWVGYMVTRRIAKKVFLIIPLSIVVGISIFIFVQSLTTLVIKPPFGIYVSYLLTFSLTLLVRQRRPLLFVKPNPLELIVMALTVFGWAALIFWKTNFALIGSDTNLYYAVAHTFIRGNSPAVTPWQPGLLLSYHLGIFQLLGAAHLFTRVDFQFIHLVFSALFILSGTLLVVGLFQPKKSVDYLFANLAAAFAFISFGFIKLVNPLKVVPDLSGVKNLFLWARALPTVNQSIEVYGSSVNLDSLIYFVFNSFGLAVLLAIVVLISRRRMQTSRLVLLGILLVVLAGSSESIFVAALPVALLMLFRKISFKKLVVFALAVVIISYIQGGLLQTTLRESSFAIFPTRGEIQEDFVGYHLAQMSSKSLGDGRYHVGVFPLFVVGAISFFVGKKRKHEVLALLLFSTFSLLVYNFVVPKYLIANGNRFLSVSYQMLSIVFVFLLYRFWRIDSRIIKIAIFTTAFWIFAATVLPPFALLSRTRFGERKLVPIEPRPSDGIVWVKDNLPYDARILVLDLNAPHLSGSERAMVQAGQFSPVFVNDYRAYTIEPNPEYVDIAYYLSPNAIRKLGVEYVLMDSAFFSSLPFSRKTELNDGAIPLLKEFLYEDSWEKIYDVRNLEIPEFGGTLRELGQIIERDAKVFIDDEENFSPSLIRKPIIFSLRERELYFTAGSGVYLNVEQQIKRKDPTGEYDYLVLSNVSDPAGICECSPAVVWRGLGGSVVLWPNYIGAVY